MSTTYKTKIDSFASCERYGFLKYFFLGHGIEPAHGAKSFALAVGSCVHAGVESLWRGSGLDVALAIALSEYDYQVHDGLFDGTDPDWMPKIKQEHRGVIEGVLTLWEYVRLPKLLSEFKFVDAEYKMVVQLAKEEGDKGEVNLYARPDAIIESLFDGRFMNWSLKTEKSHSHFKHPSALIDTGGLTESISAAMTVGGGDLKNIAGTMMEYIVVGEVAKDEPIIWHPCTRGWRRPSPAGGFDYAWKWEYENPDYDPQGPKSPKNPKSKRLSTKDGWERFKAVEYPGGIRAWVRDLADGKFFPLGVDPKDELILAPPPYSRTAGKVESFIRQQIARVRRFDHNREAVNNGTMHIDEGFQQDNNHCLKYGPKYRCEMWDICHEGAGADPFNLGYRPRQSSTEREAKKIAYFANLLESNEEEDGMEKEE